MKSQNKRKRQGKHSHRFSKKGMMFFENELQRVVLQITCLSSE